MYFVDQRANLLNLNPNITTILEHHTRVAEIANASRGAREKNGARLQCRALREVADLLRNGEDHVPTTSL